MLPMILWLFSALLVAEPIIPTHQEAVRLCIVQPPEMLYGHPVNNDAARRLAWELSRRKLTDGTLLLTITLVGYSKNAAAAEVQNQQCAYVAEVRHHQSADFPGTLSIPDLPNPLSPTDQLPPMHDSEAIMIEMREMATHKVVLRASASPISHHGRSNVVFTPFPLFAKRILDKLNALPR